MVYGAWFSFRMLLLLSYLDIVHPFRGRLFLLHFNA